ncbi:MAG: hypothetical protein IPO83_06175 [Chitinophagaceae bacterium]|nr:hypothetical protein [Chitinophagaceae bacterium]
MEHSGYLFKSLTLLVVLLISGSCKKDDKVDPFLNMDEYYFEKTHYDSVDGNFNSTTTHVTIYLDPIGKDSVINFNGDALSWCTYLQPDSACWYFTIDGLYPGSPYNGSLFCYYPANDSIEYSKWYGGSHTTAHSDVFRGKKVD